MRAILVMMLLGLLAHPMLCPAQDRERGAPFYANKLNLLFYTDDGGKLHTVRTPADWAKRRAHILESMQSVMGSLPDGKQRSPLDVKIQGEERRHGLMRRKISFCPEPGDRVEAYLLVPEDLEGRAPAMLCLHQTTSIGKDEPAGLGGDPDLHYALELARRGYVTLAPDFWSLGERKGRFDPYEHGYASGTMKGIWDHVRAVDLLQSLPEVDGERIGALGHSLGGHNALWLAAFDGRIRLVVTSCGFNSFFQYAASEYGGGDLRNYAGPRYMPRIESVFGNDPNRMPFDWPEILAMLAPRPVFIHAPLQDPVFVFEGVEDCLRAARPVYRLLGAEEAVVPVHPEGGHGFPPDARKSAYAFVDRYLRKGA